MDQIQPDKYFVGPNGNFNASDEIFPEFVLEKCKIHIPIASQKTHMNGLELSTSLKIPQ